MNVLREVIAIVVPGFTRLKGWAYAGLFFDLIGATFSAICVSGLMPEMSFMILPFGIGSFVARVSSQENGFSLSKKYSKG